jgi:hypothetical protein
MKNLNLQISGEQVCCKVAIQSTQKVTISKTIL